MYSDTYIYLNHFAVPQKLTQLYFNKIKILLQ